MYFCKSLLFGTVLLLITKKGKHKSVVLSKLTYKKDFQNEIYSSIFFDVNIVFIKDI